MKTKTLQQKVKFKTSPSEVYEMLMDSRKHPVVADMKASKLDVRFTPKAGIDH